MRTICLEKSLRLQLILGSLLCSFVACKKRGFEGKSAIREESSTTGVLDVNDVALLFPLPDNQHKGIGLTEKLQNGKSILSIELFKDALRRSGSAEVQANEKETYKNSAGEDLKSGILWMPKPFTPTTDDPADRRRSANPGFAATVDTRNPENWRIVSMRFDPCSATLERNRRSNPELRDMKSLDLKNCESELRFVAQPFDEQEQVFADFAMHIVYKVTRENVSKLVKDLLAFRQACGAETYRMPLDIHPCLGNTNATVRKSSFSQLRNLIPNYATDLSAVAVMGSVISKDPWGFYISHVSHATC